MTIVILNEPMDLSAVFAQDFPADHVLVRGFRSGEGRPSIAPHTLRMDKAKVIP